jgi:hypothetical protein
MCVKKIEFKEHPVGYPSAWYENNKMFVSYKIEVSGYYTDKLFPGDDSDWIATYKQEKMEFLLPDGFKKTGYFEGIHSIEYKEIDGVNHLIDIDSGYDDFLKFGLDFG